MINKFFNIFKFKKGIPFDPKLIEGFHNDHRNLVKLAFEIKELAKYSDSPVLLRTLLRTFKTEILVHFLQEEKVLYKYLNSLYKNDEENKEIVEEFNLSMHKIQTKVENFIEMYTSTHIISYEQEFLDDFDEVVLLLAKRIETEEKYLYSLYNKKIKTIGEKEFNQIYSKA